MLLGYIYSINQWLTAGTLEVKLESAGAAVRRHNALNSGSAD